MFDLFVVTCEEQFLINKSNLIGSLKTSNRIVLYKMLLITRLTNYCLNSLIVHTAKTVSMIIKSCYLYWENPSNSLFCSQTRANSNLAVG